MLLWSPKARKDLEDIYAWYAARNAAAAERLIHAIEQKALLIARHPEIGVSRADILDDVRSVIVSPFLIFYRLEAIPSIQTTCINILRVLDGRRDVRELL